MADSPNTQLSQMTALDWIATVVASGGSLFCLQFPFFMAPSFQRMFEDLGGTLPFITQLGLSVWFPLALAVPPLAALVLGLLPRIDLGRRRTMIVSAFVLSVLSGGVAVYSMYAPIFQISNAIQ